MQAISSFAITHSAEERDFVGRTARPRANEPAGGDPLYAHDEVSRAAQAPPGGRGSHLRPSERLTGPASVVPECPPKRTESVAEVCHVRDFEDSCADCVFG